MTKFYAEFTSCTLIMTNNYDDIINVNEDQQIHVKRSIWWHGIGSPETHSERIMTKRILCIHLNNKL